MPPREIFKAPNDWQLPANGVLFVGAKGNLFFGFFLPTELFPRGDFSGHKFPDIAAHNHYQEWTAAIVHGGKTSCPLSYSGPLTETVLLGNVAFRSAKKIDWDRQNLRAIGNPAADQFLRRRYRHGWQVDGLSSRGD